jgi:hypothetical protein
MKELALKRHHNAINSWHLNTPCHKIIKFGEVFEATTYIRRSIGLKHHISGHFAESLDKGIHNISKYHQLFCNNNVSIVVPPITHLMLQYSRQMNHMILFSTGFYFKFWKRQIFIFTHREHVLLITHTMNMEGACCFKILVSIYQANM